MPAFYVIIARKLFVPIFWGGGYALPATQSPKPINVCLVFCPITNFIAVIGSVGSTVMMVCGDLLSQLASSHYHNYYVAAICGLKATHRTNG